MSAVGQKLREAHECLARAREALEAARDVYLRQSPGCRVDAWAGLCAKPEDVLRALREFAGDLYLGGDITPADVEPTPPEPPRLSAECADEEDAPAWERANTESCRVCLALLGLRHSERCTLGDAGKRSVEWSDCAPELHPSDEEPADLEDVEARTEALLPAAKVRRGNECRECHVLKGCRHAKDCTIPREHPSPVVESDCEVTP